MKLDIARKKFIEELKSEGKSNATVVAYNKDIEQLLSFLSSKKIDEVEKISIEPIASFMKDLSEKNYTPKSISRKTNAARTFIKYLAREGYIKEDISSQLKHPKFETGAPRILSKMEYRALRDSAKNDVRSYAMIELLLQTGITISELAGIEMKDFEIKGETASLFIPKRNNKESRTIPVNKSAVDAVKRYIENERKNIPDASSNLFITKTGKALLIRNIRSTIDRFFRIAGIEKAKVNDLRHTFVAFHLENGVNISYLAKIAGHKRETTTEKYLEYIKKPEKMDKTELATL